MTVAGAQSGQGWDWRELKLALFLALPIALYFAVSPIYAVAHLDLYASDLPRLLRYVVVPAVISAAMFYVAFFMRRDWAASVALCAASILAALFAYEAVLTVKSLNASLGHVGHISDGQSAPSGVEKAMPPAYTSKALNKELGVSTLDKAILGGLPERKVLLCSRDGTPVTYMADRYGYNNPDSAYEEPVKMLIVGDSFIEGICQPHGLDVVSQTRQKFGGVIGLGTRGAGPLVELAALGRYGPVLKPRHTIIAFFAGNDWENLEAEVRKPWLTEALSADADFGAPVPDDHLVDLATSRVGEWWKLGDQSLGELMKRRAVIRNFVALQQTALNLGLHYPKASADQPVFQDVLGRASQIAQGWGGDVTLVYIPQVSQFFGKGMPDDLHGKVLAAAHRANIDVIDLQAIFESQPKPLDLYAPDAHFSPEGAALAAETISDHFAKERKALASK